VAFGSLRCSSGTPVTYNNKNDRYNIAIMYWLILIMNLCTEMYVFVCLMGCWL
jgi:hypothetical protein